MSLRPIILEEGFSGLVLRHLVATLAGLSGFLPAWILLQTDMAVGPLNGTGALSLSQEAGLSDVLDIIDQLSSMFTNAALGMFVIIGIFSGKALWRMAKLDISLIIAMLAFLFCIVSVFFLGYWVRAMALGMLPHERINISFLDNLLANQAVMANSAFCAMLYLVVYVQLCPDQKSK